MGMFDIIKCEFPLPDTEVQNAEFQTKDLECELLLYTISKEGRLLCGCGNTYSGEWHGFDDEKPHPIYYTGEVHFSTGTGNYNDGDYKTYDYTGEFKNGILISLVGKVELIKKKDTKEAIK